MTLIIKINIEIYRLLQSKLNSDYLSMKLKNNLKRKTFMINFPRNGHILLGLRNVQKLIHSSKKR